MKIKVTVVFNAEVEKDEDVEIVSRTLAKNGTNGVIQERNASIESIKTVATKEIDFV